MNKPHKSSAFIDLGKCRLHWIRSAWTHDGIHLLIAGVQDKTDGTYRFMTNVKFPDADGRVLAVNISYAKSAADIKLLARNKSTDFLASLVEVGMKFVSDREADIPDYANETDIIPALEKAGITLVEITS